MVVPALSTSVKVMVAGATADPVKDYLKQIGKVPLLNAEMEVELAKRIEAGLFAEEKVAKGGKIRANVLDELEWIVEDGRRAKNHLPEANLRGKAFLVWMNFDSSADRWVDASRIGSRIP